MPASLTAPYDDGQTPLDPDEAQALLLDWVATRADLNLAEEQNIAAGMAWAARAVHRQNVLTQPFLRAVHQRMFDQVWEWAGTYRTSERNIGVAPHAISTELKNLFDDVAVWDERSSYAIDERAARLHHRLTVIHPFPNGNGRCSRVFADLYLARASAAQFAWGAALSAEARRTEYLRAIRAADRHDYSALLAFVRA